MIPNRNRKFVLARRPEGKPREGDFELVEEPLPELGDDEVMVRSAFLSVDPYMKGRMVDAPSYAPPVRIGEIMTGGGVGEVVRSNVAEFSPGEFVEGRYRYEVLEEIGHWIAEQAPERFDALLLRHFARDSDDPAD